MSRKIRVCLQPCRQCGGVIPYNTSRTPEYNARRVACCRSCSTILRTAPEEFNSKECPDCGELFYRRRTEAVKQFSVRVLCKVCVRKVYRQPLPRVRVTDLSESPLLDEGLRQDRSKERMMLSPLYRERMFRGALI